MMRKKYKAANVHVQCIITYIHVALGQGIPMKHPVVIKNKGGVTEGERDLRNLIII